MKQTPYDTGKVKIGLLYKPPFAPTTPEEHWAQSVLLGDRQGISESTLACIQSLAVLALVVIGIALLGGFKHA